MGRKDECGWAGRVTAGSGRNNIQKSNAWSISQPQHVQGRYGFAILKWKDDWEWVEEEDETDCLDRS